MAEKRVESLNDYDAHYVKFVPSVPEWLNYKRVSENDNDGGVNPDLAVSSSKVHVNYTSFYQPKNRDRLSNGDWDNSESVPYHFLGFVNQVRDIKPIIAYNNLNSIYKAYYSSFSSSGVFIGHSYRAINGSTWYENETTLETDIIDQYTIYPHYTNNTADGKIHIIYWDLKLENWAHQYINETDFSDVIAEIPASTQSSSLSSVSNDLFLVHVYNPSSSGNIKLRQYDAAPLTPSNFAGTTHDVGWNAYPKITWSAVNEPDVRGNANGIKIQRSLNGASFTDLTTISGTSTSFIDYGVEYAGSGPANVRYKIQSVDLGSNTSDWTSIVQIQYGDVWKSGSHKDETFVVTEYNLNQNFPNPFNPQTTIQYDVKDAGFVQLKVYDILGNEVGVLVNELKESGRYNAEFNASQLTSGVYIYSIKVNDFIQHRKMTLIK